MVNQRIVNLAQCSYYEDLLSSGVRINLFRANLLHAKNVAIDGCFAVVGSSNVDVRSFELNEEASLLLYDRASVAAVKRIQADYLAGSDQVDLDSWRCRPLLIRIAENLAQRSGQSWVRSRTRLPKGVTKHFLAPLAFMKAAVDEEGRRALQPTRSATREIALNFRPS